MQTHCKKNITSFTKLTEIEQMDSTMKKKKIQMYWLLFIDDHWKVLFMTMSTDLKEDKNSYMPSTN